MHALQRHGALPARPKSKSKPDTTAQLEKVLGEHEEAANKLLEQIGWINDGKKTGQTFRDLDEKNANEVLARPSDFLAKALAA